MNIARALYFGSDIVIFDDPLSAGVFPFNTLSDADDLIHCAVDAHVGKSLFEDAILGELRSRGITVLLVTHAIHFLTHVDYIYAMKAGRIAESGTYQELMMKGGEFARLDKEYGGRSQGLQGHGDGDGVGDVDKVSESDMRSGVETVELVTRSITIAAVKLKAVRARERAAGTGKLEGRLIVKEQRSTGSVSRKGVFFHRFLCVRAWGGRVDFSAGLGFAVHLAYLDAGRGAVMLPLILLFIMMMQACQVMNSYTLVLWQAK